MSAAGFSTITTLDELAELTRYVQTSLLTSSEDIQKRENDLLKLGKLLSDAKEAAKLKNLINHSHSFFSLIDPAKAVLIVCNLVELCLKISGADENIKVDTCNDIIAWSKEQGRVHLRQTLQARLVRLFNDLHRYNDATLLSNELIIELKKSDAKDLLTQVQLENAKAFYALSTLNKSKASLNLSHVTTANFNTISNEVQAALDMYSGIINENFEPAVSYFYDAFEGYDVVNDNEEESLKYMLLSQIMIGNYSDIKMMNRRNALKYSSPLLDSLVATALSCTFSVLLFICFYYYI
uniref:26S proteasome regulatory subunit Rpn6 N-terminal domain-containing protein n=1 Tax=Panagrolaimus sp. ES5 TaxID=591445 RepID=A0AC34FAV8_9BILA